MVVTITTTTTTFSSYLSSSSILINSTIDVSFIFNLHKDLKQSTFSSRRQQREAIPVRQAETAPVREEKVDEDEEKETLMVRSLTKSAVWCELFLLTSALMLSSRGNLSALGLTMCYCCWWWCFCFYCRSRTPLM
ncbi:hypothetical protein PoB_001804400 [Plakobranchus ocellatus]|uniref:Transmembrane protein n=1 Tax=Plakobranchus ocellatus TaxID=259542 RepID=A0AAV3ZC86_9GAST|nr:hypothetical protein PoB_001804400 [Plakobranchus ocellatus]